MVKKYKILGNTIRKQVFDRIRSTWKNIKKALSEKMASCQNQIKKKRHALYIKSIENPGVRFFYCWIERLREVDEKGDRQTLITELILHVFSRKNVSRESDVVGCLISAIFLHTTGLLDEECTAIVVEWAKHKYHCPKADEDSESAYNRFQDVINTLDSALRYSELISQIPKKDSSFVTFKQIIRAASLAGLLLLGDDNGIVEAYVDIYCNKWDLGPMLSDAEIDSVINNLKSFYCGCDRYLPYNNSAEEKIRSLFVKKCEVPKYDPLF